MGEKEDNIEDNIEELSVNEEDKKQFLEELKNKNLEEEKKLEELKNKKLEEQKKLEEEKARFEEEQKKKELEEQNKQVEHIEEQHTNEEASATTEPSEDKSSKKKGTLMQNFKISFIDTAVSTVVSIAALYLFDLLLRLIFGYYVSDMKGVFIILFVVILILYPIIMRSSKLNKTLGEKFAKTTSIERKD
ncbi:hypothetical protein [Clostridium coskatii]|uniref:RDD family protein n=1 Tax=Clostridium coskatii TaxID=1705578 RepID=A0A162LAS4_9CLOT|nr:hypothetical protein [Clostridium coskatii]OAA93572.1 hypothetical protein WX73_04068 [Clostridium coskatii]OBR94453.1 hypothetical protein CLCOS_19520 [Clostridium coskatii]